MIKIAIIVAMIEEILPIRQHFQTQEIDCFGHVKVERSLLHDFELYLVEAGIGKSNAAMGATLALDRYQPDLIMNYGVVGSLTDELGLGDILIGTDFIYHDADETVFGSPYGQIPRMPVSYPLAEVLYPVVDRLKAIDLEFDIQTGQVLTSDSFVADPDRQAWIQSTFPQGRVVDMESTAIAQVAYTFDVPFLSVKTVSDDAGDMAEELYEQTKDKAALEGFKFLLKSLEIVTKFQNEQNLF